VGRVGEMMNAEVIRIMNYEWEVIIEKVERIGERKCPSALRVRVSEMGQKNFYVNPM
jgi:hypothetical protein